MRPSFRGAAGISPLISLRADLAGRTTTREDDDAVIVAVLLRHAAGQPRTKAAARSLAMARRVARRALTPDQLRQGAGFDEPRGGLEFRNIRAFADSVMRTRGCALIANNMLDSLAAIVAEDSPEHGLLLAQRAATAWYLGDNEMSAERYRQLTRLGRKLREPELVARGLHGEAQVRMSAGNLPEAERLAKRALPLASASPRIGAQATLKLAIINAVRGNFDVALDYAWRSYKLAKKFEMDRRTVLANLAQILYDAGHPAASRAAATHLLRSKVGHMQVFAVLGTYARASAALDDAAAVDWCSSRVLELAKPPSFTQPVADALLECSFALEEVGRTGKANRLRKRAHAIAVRHGYHDIAYLAEHSTPRGKPRTPKRIPKTTQAIVSEVRALEPETSPLVEIHAG
jgi:tetratricopeptide (TPR) repeat protein